MRPRRFAVIVGALVILDQATKFLVSANLQLRESLPILKGIFHITYIHNTGAAFGIFKGMLPLFIFLSVVTIILIVLYTGRSRYRHYYYFRMGLMLILAGTIGNLIDRLRFGYVIDFLDLKFWSVFNISDIAITFGAILLGYQAIVKRKA